MRFSRFLTLVSVLLILTMLTSMTYAQDVTPEATEGADANVPTAQMQAVLDQLAAFEAPPIDEVEPRIAREEPTAADAVMAVMAANAMPSGPEPVADVTHRLIPGAEGNLLVRIYTPDGEGPFPVVVYFHGGGWVIANLNVYDGSARALANAAGAVVVSVAYRQAPEAPWPAAAEDAYAATQWVVANAAEINGDPARVAVAGESAGGNLATVVTLMARDRGEAMPMYQVLVYPVTQMVDLTKPSMVEHENAAPLSTAMLPWFIGHYVPNEADRTNAYASPALAEDLSGLPPATIITAQIDPLRSDGEEYATLLSQAGVDVVYQNYAGVAHEFFGMGAVVDEGKAAVALAAEGLRSAFGN